MLKKKFMALILTFCLIVSATALFVGCGEETDTKIGAKIEIVNASGTGVANVDVEVYSGENLLTSGVTNAQGVLSFKADKGVYSVKITAMPSGYDVENTTTEFDLSSSSKSLQIMLFNAIGTYEMPDSFIGDINNTMAVTLPAKTMHYIIVYRSQGREFTINGTGFTFKFNGVKTEINGTHNVTLNGVYMDTFTGSEFILINYSDAPVTVSMTLHELEQEQEIP